MTRRTRAILIAISFMIALAGMIAVFFSTWATTHLVGASFWLTGIWFPIGIFALMSAVVLGLSAATAAIKD